MFWTASLDCLLNIVKQLYKSFKYIKLYECLRQVPDGKALYKVKDLFSRSEVYASQGHNDTTRKWEQNVMFAFGH